VQGAQGRERFPPQTKGFGHREGTALQPLGEGLALEQLHGDEEPSRVLADLEDLARMGMADAGGGAGFAPKALAGLLIGVGDGLEGEAPAQARVFGRVDDAHAPLSELVQDPISADPLGGRGFAGGDAGGGGCQAPQ
jgi:hypothetical protein